MGAPGNDLLHGFGSSLVRDWRHLHAGELLQPFGEEILRGGDAEMPVVDAPRI